MNTQIRPFFNQATEKINKTKICGKQIFDIFFSDIFLGFLGSESRNIQNFVLKPAKNPKKVKYQKCVKKLVLKMLRNFLYYPRPQ